MHIRSWLAVVAALATALAGSLAAAGPAAAASRAGASGAGSALSPATQSQLLRLFARYRGIPTADFARVRPAAVLGPKASNGRDWVMISFVAASRAPAMEKLKFQDSGGTGVFTRTAGHAWTVAGLGPQGGCGTPIPSPVRRAWHVPDCTASPLPHISHQRVAPDTAGDVVSIADAQIDVPDDPASNNFSNDCNPYTTLAGNFHNLQGCGDTESNGPYFNGVETVSEEWCADFAKWVWEEAGVEADLAGLNPLSGSFYSWAENQGENPQFNNTPEVGDAVLFYPPGDPVTEYGAVAHVGLVTSVNSNGTVDLVNGDFMNPSNDNYIQVLFNANWSASSYMGAGWNWTFISPVWPSVEDENQYCTTGTWCLNAWSGGPYVNTYQIGAANNSFFAFYNSDTGYENIEFTGNGSYSFECVSDYGNSSTDARVGLSGDCQEDSIAWGANFDEDSCGDGGEAFYNVHWGGWLGPESLSKGVGFYLNKPSEYCFTVFGAGGT
jgi:hypothetical protein